MPDLAHFTPHLPTFALLLGVVVLAGMLRRVPIVGRVVNLAILLGLVFVLAMLVDERGRMDPHVGRFMRAFDSSAEEVTGKETRVRMSRDGHFWVTARFGGTTRRMLVDSGATITALSADSATEAGLDVEQPDFPVLLRTANGTIHAQTATVDELQLGNVVARDLPVVVSPSFGNVDVLGMNFLSRLQSWRVEGDTLVLVPHHPQRAAVATS
ncbi:TIGR02281 family clan AA aspartic protease [Sphingomonas sp. MMSM20]|uniref:retropepsin-like aspartic protease family protein n=1 Tax=Sphingomonas lycopersici TaxID=2951807 RepID=UPI0022372877|nr:TIGR02281 family clan AA aspartic protease [Sphingomonas lycopersici]MCW6532688.1 TIGR02281 family clan AA aspartic protease [Sphingomonas lycopersici]